MPLDTGVFDKIKTFQDYQKADQEFQLKKALAAQQLQSGGIDAASKANVYATQLLSGATDQGSYDRAKQQLAFNGIDISPWAADFETGSKQAQQARLAQSPLGSLLNFGTKLDSNANAASIAHGEVPTDPNATAHALLQGGINQIVPGAGNLIVPSAAAAPSAPAAPGAVPASAPMTTENAQKAIDLFGGDNTPAQPVVLSTDKPARFSPPKQGPNETNAAYNARVQQDFEAYKSDPSVIAAQETAKTTATKTAGVNVDRQANYTKAQSALQGLEEQANLVTGTIDKALGEINKPNSLATGYGQIFSGLPNTDARALNNYLNTIKANIGFDKLQQMRENSPTGGALGQISDFEDRLLQAVNGALDPMQGNQLKDNLAAIKRLYPQVLAEKKRAFAQDYGGFAPIGGNPQPPPAPATANTAAAPETPQLGTTMQGTDGTYLFNGGNPADPKSWKKVK
jgi:hypothetical protein